MKKRLVPCGGCRRHVRITERACPFCATLVAAALSLLGCDDVPKPPPTATAASADLSAKPSSAPSAPQTASVASASVAPATSEPIDHEPPVVSASASTVVVKPTAKPAPTPTPRPAMKYGIAPLAPPTPLKP